jgi:5-methylcytosine-specific restriction endonuclease McrA
MQVGAAKNAGAVISAMASKGEGGTSRRPNSDVKKQADEAATGADGKQRCAYCGKELTNETGKPNSKEYDHVKPYLQGGDSSSGNIKDACRTCNRQKGARTPEEWKGQQ